MAGWVKIFRKLQDWQWYSDSRMVHLFIHLLLEANHEDRFWMGQKVKRGQLIFGRKSASETLGISEQSLRTCIERLKSTNEITIKSTSRYSLITVVKYEDYQEDEIKSTSRSTSKSTLNQPAINQQSTTPKELKNIKNKDIMSGRARRFVEFVNERLKRNYKFSDKITSSFKQRIEKDKYSAQELKTVFDSVIASSYHIETGFKYCTPEFLLRQSTIEKYKNGPILNLSASSQPEPPKNQDHSERLSFFETQQNPVQKSIVDKIANEKN